MKWFMIALMLIVLSGCTWFESQVMTWQPVTPRQSVQFVLEDNAEIETIRIWEKPFKGSLTGVQHLQIEIDGQLVILNGQSAWVDNHPATPGLYLEIAVNGQPIHEIEIRSGHGVGLVRLEVE
jgi:hypothetical protein